MHSSFYQAPLRDMFVRRVLWNMPKIKPEDYRKEDHDQTLPESPQIPPLTPPSPTSTPSPIHIHSSPRSIVLSKRRKRPQVEPNMERTPPKKERKVPEKAKHADHGVVRTKLEEMQWVPVPLCSSKEKLKVVQDQLKDDPYLCRFCCDSFCRDPTWGDPYLISCAKCDANYHSFCVENKPSKAAWRCHKCTHSSQPGVVTRPDNNPATLCQFCHRQSPGVAGRLVEYGGLGDPPTNYVHENCAFYSKGVTKQEDRWYGIQTAVRESIFTKCSFCQKKGASIPCDFPKCRKLLHYLCAKHNQCYLVENDNQHLFCDQHMELVLKNPGILHKNQTPLPPPSSPEISVPQSAHKKEKLATRKSKRKRTVPDPDGELDSSPSCQVL